jgi:hypothetical protein
MNLYVAELATSVVLSRMFAVNELGAAPHERGERTGLAESRLTIGIGARAPRLSSTVASRGID